MISPLPDILGPTRRLAALARFKRSIGLMAAAQDAAADSGHIILVQALDELAELPSSMRRLAWVSSFGGPMHSRLGKEEIINTSWEEGVNRIAGGMPDPSGAVGILRLLGALPSDKVKEAMCRAQDTEAFGVLYSNRTADVLAVDSLCLARLGTLEQLRLLDSVFAGKADAPEAIVCRTGFWLHALINCQMEQPHPPLHAATAEILTAPWARGLRRGAARRLGLLQGESLKEAYRGNRKDYVGIRPPMGLRLPGNSGGPLEAEIGNLLAPLLIEWFSCFMQAIDSECDSNSRLLWLYQVAPNLAEEIRGLIREDNRTALRWLQGLLEGSVEVGRHN